MSNRGDLGLRVVEDMEQLTWDRVGPMAVNNAATNLPHVLKGKSIAALRNSQIGAGDSAIIIAAGPSIARHDPISQIKASKYNGAIIATDSAMYYCLKNGVVPDLVVTVDPQGDRIVRWFGKPSLSETHLEADDYFRRQDMDASFASEMRTNQELLALLDAHGRKIRIALSTSAAPQVVERALQVGMDIYWWNPMLDDPDVPNSKTLDLYRTNRLPCLNAGGNVGTASWMMAHAVLGKTRVALTGVDFSYYGDTPYRNTQYYKEMVDIFGEKDLDRAYVWIKNPHLGSEFFTDPAYLWYRNCFLELAADADCVTYNCTQGGILFGESVRFADLKQFLAMTSPAPTQE